MLLNATAEKLTVMALDKAVTDQLVSRAMGREQDGSENIAPIVMQPKRLRDDDTD